MAFIREEDNNTVDEIIPIPHFVIKTKIFSPFDIHPSGTKLFINVCTNEKIPTKEVPEMDNSDFNLQKIFTSISEGEWEIPILTSSSRVVLDKKQNKSLLIDCVINDKYMKWCMLSEELKEILIQWCFDAVEFNLKGLVIDRDVINFPKRKSMGGSPESIFIDIHEVEDKVKQLEKVGSDIYGEEINNDEPSSLLEAKRFGEEMGNNMNDLSDLLGNKKVNPGKQLIFEVEETEEDIMKEEKRNETKTIDKDVKKDIKFEIEMQKLDKHDTEDSYKFLIKIKSVITKYEDYKLQFDSNEKDLLISSIHGKTHKFPLPLDTTGICESFFVKPEQKLFVYIK